jgi:nitrogen fixation NifU-like protein
MNLYKDLILDLYRHPLNYGELINPDIVVSEINQLCGDMVKLAFKFDDNDLVSEIKFTAEGCAISIATTSILTELVKGKHKSALIEITSQDILTELGINPGPSRLRCALLGLEAMKKALR